MILRETPLPGVRIVEPERLSDERGFFARVFCARTFAEAGLEPGLVQASISYNIRQGTLRGLHFQRPPHGEAKLVRCTAGAMFDVAVDLRLGSPAFGRWFGIELTSANRLALYIPPGVAHGFQTLADDTEVSYHMATEYVPGASGGVRWDDPVIGVAWPDPAGAILSDRDRALPCLADLSEDQFACF